MGETVSLLEILRLEPVEVNLFRGFTPAPGFVRSRIFGGQVIAQALLAAYRTVEGRVCHSLHAYFLRPGDPSIPVLYEVERARDGKSFATRRVIAIQHGEQIFNLSASFQIPEAGLEHQATMPSVPRAEDLDEQIEQRKAAAALLPKEVGESLVRERPIEIRPVDPAGLLDSAPLAPVQRAWFRAREAIGDDIALQQAVLAYASDMMLLSTSLLPHAISWTDPKMQMASLDHTLWFHRPSDLSQWHLYDRDSPSASGARGFNRGEIYRHDGMLIASACQEGLIRLRR
jgi:acyl-CoA thioesterase-2